MVHPEGSPRPGKPLSDAELLLEGTQGAPEALVRVDQAAALLAVLPRALGRPREPAHQIRNAQRRRTAHSRPTVHQYPCNTTAQVKSFLRGISWILANISFYVFSFLISLCVFLNSPRNMMYLWISRKCSGKGPHRDSESPTFSRQWVRVFPRQIQQDPQFPKTHATKSQKQQAVAPKCL